MAKPIRKIETFLGIPNFSQLFPPQQEGQYDYFKGGLEFPFESKARQHSAVNAWWMAELSLLAYCEKQAVERILKNRFPESSQYFWLDSKETNTQGFMLETDNFIVITFRGTEFPPPSHVISAPKILLDVLADIKTDIWKLSPQLITEGTPGFDTPVHPGFAHALQSVWSQLQARLTTNTKPLWLTGHSLGAAIATLLAYQIPERVAALYTFGSPCVGTVEFVNAFNDKGLAPKTYRYLHGNDAVAKALDKFTPQYHPVGQLYSLDAGNRRGLLAQGLNFVLGSTVGVNLLDHPPIFYSYECWNAIPLNT